MLSSMVTWVVKPKPLNPKPYRISDPCRRHSIVDYWWVTIREPTQQLLLDIPAPAAQLPLAARLKKASRRRLRHQHQHLLCMRVRCAQAAGQNRWHRGASSLQFSNICHPLSAIHIRLAWLCAWYELCMQGHSFWTCCFLQPSHTSTCTSLCTCCCFAQVLQHVHQTLPLLLTPLQLLPVLPSLCSSHPRPLPLHQPKPAPMQRPPLPSPSYLWLLL